MANQAHPVHHPGPDPRPCFFRYITLITRTIGTLTVIALWAILIHMMESKNNYHFVHWYLLAICPVVSFLEICWFINKSACCVEQGCCCRIWKLVMWIDNWKKAILYIGFSIPFLTQAVLLSIICGCLLLFCASLYIMKSFRYSNCWYKNGQAGVSLVTGDPSDPHTDYDSVKNGATQPVVPSTNTPLHPPASSPAPSAPPPEEGLKRPVQASD